MHIDLHDGCEMIVTVFQHGILFYAICLIY